MEGWGDSCCGGSDKHPECPLRWTLGEGRGEGTARGKDPACGPGAVRSS